MEPVLGLTTLHCREHPPAPMSTLRTLGIFAQMLNGSKNEPTQLSQAPIKRMVVRWCRDKSGRLVPWGLLPQPSYQQLYYQTLLVFQAKVL